jgi:MFS family permease
VLKKDDPIARLDPRDYEVALAQARAAYAQAGVLGTMLGAFMAVLDIQITNASLRDITGGIAATQDEGSWVSTSYLIGEIITIPLTAWLVRVFSARWYLFANVTLFLLFSCLCGLARSLGAIIVFRAITSIAACPAARRSDGTSAGRCGSSGDCTLARP